MTKCETVTIELNIDELQQQLRAGTRCGLLAGEGSEDLLPDVLPKEIFQKALAMALMAVRRDLQASANHAIYCEGYGYGLKIARDYRV